MNGLFGWLGTDLTTADALKGLPATARAGSRHALHGRFLARQDDRYAALSHAAWRDTEDCRHAAQHGPAATLLRAYRRHGSACFAALQGPFVAAIIDGGENRLLAAVDRVGREVIYCLPLADGVLFGSDLQWLRIHPLTRLRLSAQGLYNYTYFHMLPSPESIFSGLTKLPAGHCIDWRPEHSTVTPYWQPDFGRQPAAGIEQLAEELRELLPQALRRALPENDPTQVGAFLSGGLDSSTVAGLLAQLNNRAPSYSIGFDADGYDELPYARISAAHFGNRANEYYVTPDDVVAAVPQIAASYDEPFGNSSAVPAYYCARLAAADGIRRLLAGDGGDELFAGNERYAKQQLFSHYQRLPGPLRGALEAALPKLPQRWLLGKARSYVEQARVALPDRLQSYNFLHRIDPRQVFDPAFLASVDRQRPLQLLRERYRQPVAASELDRMLYLDWQFTLADNDLRKVSRMCAVNGVEVAYPLLDDELLAFSCRVPDRFKLTRRELRYFFKYALRSFLPPQVLSKSKHGFGLPFGVWMRDHPRLQQLAYDSLNSLRERRYFRTDFLDRAAALHRGGHAAYYGELIWMLMMLELWLQHNQSGGDGP